MGLGCLCGSLFTLSTGHTCPGVVCLESSSKQLTRNQSAGGSGKQPHPVPGSHAAHSTRQSCGCWSREVPGERPGSGVGLRFHELAKKIQAAQVPCGQPHSLLPTPQACYPYGVGGTGAGVSWASHSRDRKQAGSVPLRACTLLTAQGP